jgi:CRP/FNR family transcriptional regulator
MKTSRDLHVQYKCQECDQESHGFLCQVSGSDLKGFDSIKVTKVYPKGTVLFVEGQSASAVYMLCQGKVKLSTCSREGKVIILDVVEAGDVIGLSAALNGAEYEATAEVLELCQVNYIKTPDLLRFLQNNPEACLNAARQLSRNYLTAYRQVCSLGLSDSVVDKLARLFLDWCGNQDHGNGSVRLKNPFTHEDMAEMIGTSRETVTRALKFFRDHELISVKGSDLVILDRQRLVDTIGNRRTLRTAV